MWSEDDIISLVDPSISGAPFQAETVRCMHVGLLCVQQLAKDRPNMSTVISMLVRDIMDLPNPKQPGFIQRQTASDTGSYQMSEQTSSTNDVTVTALSPR